MSLTTPLSLSVMAFKYRQEGQSFEQSHASAAAEAATKYSVDSRNQITKDFQTQFDALQVGDQVQLAGGTLDKIHAGKAFFTDANGEQHTVYRKDNPLQLAKTIPGLMDHLESVYGQFTEDDLKYGGQTNPHEAGTAEYGAWNFLHQGGAAVSFLVDMLNPAQNPGTAREVAMQSGPGGVETPWMSGAEANPTYAGANEHSAAVQRPEIIPYRGDQTANEALADSQIPTADALADEVETGLGLISERINELVTAGNLPIDGSQLQALQAIQDAKTDGFLNKILPAGNERMAALDAVLSVIRRIG